MRIHARTIPYAVVLGCAILTISACKESGQVETKGSPETKTKTAAASPPQVSVTTIHPSPRPYIRELPGRIAPTQVAEVRARVAGIVIERAFTQGADVKAGDVLYRIDPARYEVELSAAEAALAKAKAAEEQARLQAARVGKLIKGQAASEAQFENATANWRQAQADVAARDADVAKAKLDLDYTNVRSPISGRIGRALMTEGALVGHGEATHLATVQQLDPIYADFTQAASELQQLRRDFDAGVLDQIAPDATKVRLVLDDGSLYPYPGRLLFSGVSVDPSTGQVTLRGEFPNPKSELLPGGYVRVQIEQGIDADSLAVPQQAVRRNDTGGSEVYLVRDDNRAVIQPIRVGRVVDGQWLVLEGLKPGDRVVVEGFQKFSAGDLVEPVSRPLASAATTLAGDDKYLRN
jgi:membrane fusion protein (multidrug efflux system)